MNRFKNILLICDELSLHEKAIKRAMTLAKANGASITLMDVFESPPGELTQVFGRFSGSSDYDLEGEIKETMRSRLVDVGAQIRADGTETTEVVAQGVAFVEIIRQVLRGGHDLLMKGAAGESDSRFLFFGSTDLHLLRKCPCPVWVMRRSGRHEYGRILAAVDLDSRDATRDALNRMILDLGSSLSEMDGCELHVVNAWKLPAEETLRHSAFVGISSDEVDRMARAEFDATKEMLQRLASHYPGIDPDSQLHLIKGEARHVITEFALDRRMDLIVMGTVGRTGVPGFLIGNTAESIINQVACSVLAIKPPGFETPISLN